MITHNLAPFAICWLSVPIGGPEISVSSSIASVSCYSWDHDGVSLNNIVSIVDGTDGDGAIAPEKEEGTEMLGVGVGVGEVATV